MHAQMEKRGVISESTACYWCECHYLKIGSELEEWPLQAHVLWAELHVEDIRVLSLSQADQVKTISLYTQHTLIDSMAKLL